MDKYFSYLKDLDDKTKERLINKLTPKGKNPKKEVDIKDLFGAWEDNRNSEEIISDIKDSRVNKITTEGFE